MQLKTILDRALFLGPTARVTKAKQNDVLRRNECGNVFVVTVCIRIEIILTLFLVFQTGYRRCDEGLLDITGGRGENI